MLYDAEDIRTYFDQYVTEEWDRLERTLPGRVKYAIHRRLLDEYVPPGARVLDVGCGPGRFALDLARRGHVLTLVDLSPKQLDSARQHLQDAGLLDRVEALHCLDVTDMHVLAAASFDVVLCYGAVLSYTFDRYEAALSELVRVLRPGGRLLVGVISLYGILRMIGPLDAQAFLENAETHMEAQATLAGAQVAYTRPHSPEFHQSMVMFTAEGLSAALRRAGLHVVATAAAGPLVCSGMQMPKVAASATASAALTELELALCTRPGLADAGEHLLAVAVKSESPGGP